MKSKKPVLKIVLIAWVVFSILYVGYTQYRYLTNFVASTAYQRGLSEAVVQVVQQAQKCEAFQVQIDGQGVSLINTKCLQQQPAAAAPATDNSSEGQ